uniref:MD-2-related lipid-recognition domain-containing protein n=1 Tax=Anopheles coluzzii TaxID=1518534 RepID=A0A6E8W7G1_ANOCL
MLSNVIHSLIWVVGILMLLCPAPYAENVFSYEDQKNFTRQFKIQVQRLVCNEAPYKETVLLECRMIFRRNQRSLLCMSLKVPKLYHYVMVQFQLNYKFTTYQTFLIDGKVEGCAYMRHQNNDPVLTYMYGVLKDMIPSVVHPCPLGNKTYTELTMLKEEYAPKSMPAGDYRMDVRFSTKTNVTLFSLQLFFGVRRRGILNSMIEW